MNRHSRHLRQLCAQRALELRVVVGVAALASVLIVSSALASLSAVRVSAQQPETPVVVQPGAPGKPTKMLPATTRAKLPPVSAADVQFM